MPVIFFNNTIPPVRKTQIDATGKGRILFRQGRWQQQGFPGSTHAVNLFFSATGAESDDKNELLPYLETLMDRLTIMQSGHKSRLVRLKSR